jgi:hypothetical protein
VMDPYRPYKRPRPPYPLVQALVPRLAEYNYPILLGTLTSIHGPSVSNVLII